MCVPSHCRAAAGDSRVPRLEYAEGHSQKFWEIEVQDRWVTVRWGRLGTVGTQRTSEHETAEDAHHAAELRLNEKLRKGYRRVDEAPPAVEASAARNPALEAAIASSVGDVDARRVYADWLLDQGSDLGELIQLELALNREPTSELFTQVNQLRLKYAGGLADSRAIQLGWHLGLIRRARLTVHGPGVELLDRLFGLPAAAVLLELRLTTFASASGEASRARMFGRLVAHPPTYLGRLELLHHHDVETVERERYAEGAGLWDALPSLHTLRVNLPRNVMQAPHERLRRFGFTVGDEPHVAWVLGRSWPCLEHLEVHRGAAPPFDVDRLADLLAPQLHTLTLSDARGYSRQSFRHLERLLTSPLGSRLRRVHLPAATQAPDLERWRAQWTHLEVLDNGAPTEFP